MKKFILFLVLAASSMTVQATTIKWAIGGALDASAGIDTSVGSFVLAYVGTTSGVGVDGATFTANYGTEGNSYEVVQTKNWSDFYSSRKGTYANTQNYTVAEKYDINGATFQAFYVQDGVYSLVNDPTLATIAISVDNNGITTTPAYKDGQSTGASQLFAAGGSATPITSVPEPSVAFMGLLGLGMLLKRRKA